MFFYVECLTFYLAVHRHIQGCIFFYNPPKGGGGRNQRLLGQGKKIKEWKTRAGKETAREREGEKEGEREGEKEGEREGEREAEGKDKGKGKKKEKKIRVQKQMKEKRIWGERK